MDKVVDEISRILEETLFVPYDEVRDEIITSFPELTRLVYRNVDIHVQKIRTIVKEMSYPKRKIADLRKVISDVKTIMHTKKIESMEYSQDLLYSMIGKFVVLDLQNGEIEYEV